MILDPLAPGLVAHTSTTHVHGINRRLPPVTRGTFFFLNYRVSVAFRISSCPSGTKRAKSCRLTSSLAVPKLAQRVRFGDPSMFSSLAMTLHSPGST